MRIHPHLAENAIRYFTNLQQLREEIEISKELTDSIPMLGKAREYTSHPRGDYNMLNRYLEKGKTLEDFKNLVLSGKLALTKPTLN